MKNFVRRVFLFFTFLLFLSVTSGYALAPKSDILSLIRIIDLIIAKPNGHVYADVYSKISSMKIDYTIICDVIMTFDGSNNKLAIVSKALISVLMDGLRDDEKSSQIVLEYLYCNLSNDSLAKFIRDKLIEKEKFKLITNMGNEYFKILKNNKFEVDRERLIKRNIDLYYVLLGKDDVQSKKMFYLILDFVLNEKVLFSLRIKAVDLLCEEEKFSGDVIERLCKLYEETFNEFLRDDMSTGVVLYLLNNPVVKMEKFSVFFEDKSIVCLLNMITGANSDKVKKTRAIKRIYEFFELFPEKFDSEMFSRFCDLLFGSVDNDIKKEILVMFSDLLKTRIDEEIRYFILKALSDFVLLGKGNDDLNKVVVDKIRSVFFDKEGDEDFLTIIKDGYECPDNLGYEKILKCLIFNFVSDPCYSEEISSGFFDIVKIWRNFNGIDLLLKYYFVQGKKLEEEVLRDTIFYLLKNDKRFCLLKDMVKEKVVYVPVPNFFVKIDDYNSDAIGTTPQGVSYYGDLTEVKIRDSLSFLTVYYIDNAGGFILLNSSITKDFGPGFLKKLLTKEEILKSGDDSLLAKLNLLTEDNGKYEKKKLRLLGRFIEIIADKSLGSFLLDKGEFDSFQVELIKRAFSSFETDKEVLSILNEFEKGVSCWDLLKVGIDNYYKSIDLSRKYRIIGVDFKEYRPVELGLFYRDIREKYHRKRDEFKEMIDAFKSYKNGGIKEVDLNAKMLSCLVEIYS
ncbi:hypothetical protein KKC59_04610 [bacterium]|nr:hypothetical protein [bacterium]